MTQHNLKILTRIIVAIAIIALAALLIHVFLIQFKHGQPVSNTPLPIHKVQPPLIKKSAIKTNKTRTGKTASSETNKYQRLAGYYTVYKDPYVKFIRQAINGYFAGTSDWTSNPARVKGCDQIRVGMGCSRSYLHGKFIVWAINPSIIGGEDIDILFQNKPDKVFRVWVFKTSDGRFDLREFREDFIWTPDRIAYFKRTYPNLINDKVHSL